MKRFLCILNLLGLSAVLAFAENTEARRTAEIGKQYKEFVAGNGQVYKNVTITTITDAGISITHADGLARLRYEQLTQKQREDFGITKANSEAIYAEEAKVKAAYDAKVAEAEKAKREADEKHAVALAERERQIAETDLRQHQAGKTTIESTLEIPAMPVIRGTKTGVIYSSNGQSNSSRSTYYISPGYYGGYGYPSPYGYYPSPYHGHHPTKNGCAPAHRGPIFHFTIK